MTDADELERLTQAYLDGRIEAADAGRLNALLSEDAGARRAFADALNLDTAIAATAIGWQLEDEAARAEPPRAAAFPVLARWLALAAGVALVLGATWLWQSRGSTAFATVEKGVGVGEQLPAGMEVLGSKHTIEAGTVELLTARGARVIIEAPAEFYFESAQRLHMLRGRLSADVPAAAKGFTVVTPSGDAIDLGTRFGVDVPESGASEIHVFEGEVIAKANGAEGEQSLRAGDALAMGAGANSVLQLRSSAFIQREELRDLLAGMRGDRQLRSDAALAALRADPAAIAVLDFEGDRPFPGTFRSVQGRWPGSRAPEFVRAGDHLKLDVGGGQTWPQLTLAAWVRLDSLGALYQSLLHADGWEGENFGLVHWMVNQATTMRFAMWGNRLAPGERESQPYPDSRTPVSSDQGRWVHLATVYDSATGTVRFFHNGDFDKEVKQSTAYPARLGPIQIGNWNQGERKLSGRVDEFVILGRAMSDAEVRALYEVGNPYR